MRLLSGRDMEKRKRFFGRKRKMASEQAVEWYVEYGGLTETEAQEEVSGKRIKKEKKRAQERGQKMR
jgi:hypothetical protein